VNVGDVCGVSNGSPLTIGVVLVLDRMQSAVAFARSDDEGVLHDFLDVTANQGLQPLGGYNLCHVPRDALHEHAQDVRKCRSKVQSHDLHSPTVRASIYWVSAVPNMWSR
jgi:hypothetical protein